MGHRCCRRSSPGFGLSMGWSKPKPPDAAAVHNISQWLLADRCSALCTWDPSPAASGILHTFARQALPFVWDYAEGVPLEAYSGGWLPTLEWIALVIDRETSRGGV